MPDIELKQALIEAALEQDLEFAVRVTSIGGAGGGAAAAAAARGGRFPGAGGRGGGFPGGAGGAIGDPVAIYKVYADGREELVRGCEFGSFDVGSLKDIIAAGRTPVVYNSGSTTGARASVVAPAVLFEELELFAIEEERQALPIIEAPHQRAEN